MRLKSRLCYCAYGEAQHALHLALFLCYLHSKVQMTTSMKPLSRSFSFALAFLVLQVQGEETITVQGRISAGHNPPDEMWIGVFTTPVRPRAEAVSWNSVDSAEFELAVPHQDEVQLVVLSRDFLPLMQTIHPLSSNTQFELQLKTGITMEGTVLSTDKISIPDAVLTMERRDLPNVRIPDHLDFSWVSNAHGSFKIGGLAPNIRYLVEVEVPSANISKESFSIQVSESDNRRRHLQLSNAYFVLGRVVDADQVGVQEAIVSFEFIAERWRGYSLNSTTTSDNSGEFKLGPFIRNREVWVWATHENWGSSQRIRVTSGLHDTELVLTSLVHVVGTVVDEISGNPIGDFKLVTIGPKASREYPHSGSNGKISCFVDRQSTNLIVDSPNYSVHFKLNINLKSLEQYDVGLISLERGRQLAGIVFDESSGEPISGATVFLLAINYDTLMSDYLSSGIKSLYLSESVRSTTDEKGAYELATVPPDPALIGIYADEYLSKDLPIDAIATQLDIPLTKDRAEKSTNRRIIGRVLTSTGEPIGGKVFFLRGEAGSGSTSVRDDGTFDYWLRAESCDVYAITDQGRSNRVRVELADYNGQEITLVVNSTGRLRGVIEGLALGETVSLTIVDESERIGSRNVRGLGNGDFVVDGIGIGTFDVTATTNKKRSQTKSFELSAESDEASVNLYFTGQSRLFGSLTYQDGSVPQGEVEAVSKDSGRTSGSGNINDDGNIEIQGLEDGEYTVLVYESRQATLMTPDGGSSETFSRYLVEKLDVVIRGDTELNIQLVSPDSSE